VSQLSLATAERPVPAHGVSFAEAVRVWLRVAALSFGGPAGQIAVMHRIIVDEKRWVGERRFLHALSYCMLLPGPEAQQLATYIGWLMHRWPGAVAAGGLFVLPGVIAIMGLSWIYAAFGNLPIIAALFFGLKAAVLAIVLHAVYRVGSRALKSGPMIALAAVAFVAIFFGACRSRSSFSAPRSSALSAPARDLRPLRSAAIMDPRREATRLCTACSARSCPSMCVRQWHEPCGSPRFGSGFGSCRS
jgi:chromate transport protein ChrA